MPPEVCSVENSGSKLLLAREEDIERFREEWHEFANGIYIRGDAKKNIAEKKNRDVVEMNCFVKRKEVLSRFPDYLEKHPDFSIENLKMINKGDKKNVKVSFNLNELKVGECYEYCSTNLLFLVNPYAFVSRLPKLQDIHPEYVQKAGSLVNEMYFLYPYLTPIFKDTTIVAKLPFLYS